jgi:hypothetical protein
LLHELTRANAGRALSVAVAAWCGRLVQARADEEGGKKKKGKLRAPAWCDRILWRTQRKPASQGDHHPTQPVLEQLKYFSVKLRASDHMPVGAFFRMRVRTIDTEGRLKLKQCLHEEVGSR